MKKKYLYWLGAILLIALLVLVYRWNDYREKEMTDVLDAEEVDELLYTMFPSEDEVGFFNRSITDPSSIKELTDFFGQYKVKKIGARSFSPEYPDEQFSFQLEYTDDRITMSSLIERDVLLVEHEQYAITNGPVDYNWIQDYLGKHE